MVMSFNPVPPFGTGKILLTSAVRETWLDVTNPSALLCKTPAVVNFGRYSELDALPITTFPVDVPVLIFVAKFELLFRLTSPPDIVVPKLPVSNPDDVMEPPAVV
jgi:hypothetical protein